jgi:hypothetical protein
MLRSNRSADRGFEVTFGREIPAEGEKRNHLENKSVKPIGAQPRL